MLYAFAHGDGRGIVDVVDREGLAAIDQRLVRGMASRESRANPGDRVRC